MDAKHPSDTVDENGMVVGISTTWQDNQLAGRERT